MIAGRFYFNAIVSSIMRGWFFCRISTQYYHNPYTSSRESHAHTSHGLFCQPVATFAEALMLWIILAVLPFISAIPRDDSAVSYPFVHSIPIWSKSTQSPHGHTHTHTNIKEYYSIILRFTIHGMHAYTHTTMHYVFCIICCWDKYK